MHAVHSQPLWPIAQYVLDVLAALFGLPADIAAQHNLLRREHQLLASWLRSAEALVRRLLLIEARRFALVAPPPPPTRSTRPRARRLMGFSPDDPAAWRVAFRMLAPVETKDARGYRRAGADPAARFPSAWPLAERYEALLRACADPAPYARRFARRLARAPHRIEAALAAPPEADDRIAHFLDIGEQARALWRAPDSG